MHEWPATFLRDVIDAAPEGIVICDALASDQPVVYADAAFEQRTGYNAAELKGTNLRLLQGSDREQEGRGRVREAITNGTSCRVLLRNFRKDGSSFWNELLLQPLRDSTGALTHFVGYHRDAGERMKAADRVTAGLPTWLREDRLTGLSTRAYFEELLARDWSLARREDRPLTMILFDVDGLGAYNDTFGRSGGDACLRRVARVIGGSFRRGSDLVGRWEGGTIAALVRDNEHQNVLDFATMICQRVFEMHIHHPKSALQKFVTVSAGVASMLPDRDASSPENLAQGAQAALRRAKEGGGGLTLAADARDIAGDPHGR
jgi:diguanylate cyclase (GGDEF)-like protein/PAS domain S-box-containing protein